VVGRTQGNDGLHPWTAAKMLHVLPRDQAALAVPHDVEALEARSLADALQLVGYALREVLRPAGVEAEQTAEVEREHAEAIEPEPILHHLPNVPRLEKPMQQQHGFCGIREVVPADDAVAAAVHAAKTAELVSERAPGAEGRSGLVHHAAT
jgi:hypothetical protein